MPSFWDKLPLWEKMVIVLAGAMIGVLGFGCCKLLSTRMKMRKLAKQSPIAQTDLESANISEDTIVDPILNVEIPFGIRALEAGVKVEGVEDMSRPSSPARASFRQSSNMTLVGAGENFGSLNGAEMESPRSSIAPPPSVSNYYMRSVHSPHPYGYSHQHNGSTSSFPSTSSSPSITRQSLIENEPAMAQPYMTQPLARPPLAVRGPSPQFSPRRPRMSPDGPRSYPMVYGPSSSRSPSPPDSSTLPSVREDENLSLEGSDYSRSNSDGEERRLPTRSDSAEERGRDLSLLDHHRISHAAEIGQLERRPPGPSRASTWSNANIPTLHTAHPASIYGPPSPVFSAASTYGPEGYAYAVEPELPPAARRSISIAQFNQNLELAGSFVESQSQAPPSMPADENPFDNPRTAPQPETQAENQTDNAENSRPKSSRKSNKLVRKSWRNSETEV